MDTPRRKNASDDRKHLGHSSFSVLAYLWLFGLAISLPLLLLVGALLLQFASAQRGQLENRVLQVLDDLVNDIDRALESDIVVLRTLATSQALKSSDWPSFYRDAQAGLQGRAYLVLVDATGRQLVNTYVPYGEQPAMTGDPESVRRAIQTKAPVVSNLFVSLVVKKPVFNVSIPIVQADQVRYLMSLGRLPEDLETVLKGQNLDSSWVSLVWDANAVIMARSSDNPLYVGQPLPNSLRNYSRRGVIRTAGLNGSDVLHATARSQVSGWGVEVSVPYSLITETIRNALLIWAAAAVLAITLASACGLFFARQITESLSIAARAAAAFGRGEPFPLAGSHLREANAFLTTLREAQLARETLTDELRSSAEEVRAANELLLRANEDLNQFAFAASHDLQEPLRMITSYAQLLVARFQFDGEAETYIGFITEGTRRMRELLADLLNYTRLTGDQEHVTPVDLNEVFQAMLENCKAAIEEASATVTSDQLPAVLGHKQQFIQLFQNLVSNSLKYRSELSPMIHISAERQDGLWRIAAKDNGMGIAPEYHDQIFGVFKRLHGKKIPGTGIGLAICKRVVERHGGKIWVESQPGQGATFYFTLPATSNGVAAHG